MRAVALATIVTVIVTAGRAHGLDASGVDIIGLRLGMPAPEVASRLVAQGYTLDRKADTIAATTRDGRMWIILSGDGLVTRISYVLEDRGIGSIAKLREALFTRFGDPDQATPPTWCRTVARDGTCPRNQASLTFLAEKLTLLLRNTSEEAPPTQSQ